MQLEYFTDFLIYPLDGRISANIKNERQVLSESRIESKHKIGFNDINSAFVLSIPREDCENPFFEVGRVLWFGYLPGGSLIE